MNGLKVITLVSVLVMSSAAVVLASCGQPNPWEAYGGGCQSDSGGLKCTVEIVDFVPIVKCSVEFVWTCKPDQIAAGGCLYPAGSAYCLPGPTYNLTFYTPHGAGEPCVPLLSGCEMDPHTMPVQDGVVQGYPCTNDN